MAGGILREGCWILAGRATSQTFPAGARESSRARIEAQLYLLDTNACIRILNGTSPTLVAALESRHPSELHLCSIVKAELLYGARKSRRVAENLETLRLFFEPFVSLPFDDSCSEHYGAIRAELEARGTLIGPNDLVIAATARAHDLTLVTHNAEEFTRVVGLAVEDWEIERI